MDRILLGQLGAGGDCLYATILARQLRADFPEAEICWAVSTQCKGLLVNNPDIDAVWEIPVADWSYHEMAWRVFEREAYRQYQQRNFGLILLSQIWPNNFQNYDGTVRSSLLRAYGRPITVPIENVICLTDEEIARVEDFARENRLPDTEHTILFECSSKSGQSSVTPESAQDIAAEIYALLPHSRVIFSTHLPMELRDERSLYAGTLSLREVSHLTHHVSLFVGTGSGGTVAASSTAARILPMVQVLKASTSVFASFAHDFEYFDLHERQVLELTDEDPKLLARAIASACTSGVAKARAEYGTPVQVEFTHYLNTIETYLMRFFRFLDAARSLQITARRYGWSPQLLAFAKERVSPRLEQDPSWYFQPNRHKGAAFRAEIAAPAPPPATQRLWSEPADSA